MRIQRSCAVALVGMLAGAVLWAQGRGGPDWPTPQGDAQGTSWLRGDPNISVEGLSKPGFSLQWKTTLDNQPRQSHSLAQGVTVNGVTLFTPLALITGASNNVFAIDTDTGRLFWQRHFEAPLPAEATADCPGGITGAATREASLEPAAPAVGRPGGGGFGGAGYRGAVGLPGEGAPDINGRGARRGAAPQRGPAPAPGRAAGAANAPRAGAPGRAGAAPARGARRGGGGGYGYGRPSGVVYAVSSDGTLHTLGLPSSIDIEKPIAFLPPNARVSDLVAADNDMLYAATSGHCGGAPNAVWAADLASDAGTVTSWKTNGGNPVGSVALGTDGTVFAAIGPGPTAGGYSNAIVALDQKTLALKDWFTAPNAEFVTGPVVFKEGPREIVAAATKDGRVLLLDARSLGGANHTTPLYVSPAFTSDAAAFAPGALATWEDLTPAAGAAAPEPGTGTRWLLLPVGGPLSAAARAADGSAATSGAIVALEVKHAGTGLSLTPGWVFPQASPVTPIIVNDVVFAATGAEGPTVLDALDGRTGKPLWNSAKTITAALSARSLWSSNSQVYVGTTDGTVYAFGFALERH